MKKTNENEIEITLFDKTGKLRDKEAILKELDKAYNSLVEETDCDDFSTADFFSNPESYIDVQKTHETYEFYKRNIYIYEDITGELAESVYKQIDFYNTVDDLDEVPLEKRKPINIIINSPGGSVYAAYTIIDKMKSSKTPIYTYNIGYAFSAGCLISICGTKRFVSKHGYFLIHQGAGHCSDEAGKVMDFMLHYKTVLKQMKETVLENTNISEKEYDEKIREDLYLTADEALKMGLVDEIIGG